jgi:hypothetical protein
MNVVSEFVREDLFAEHLTPRRGGQHLAQQQNVVVDLRISMEERWLRYAHEVRTNVHRAERAGLRVEIGDSESFLEPFLGIYYDTMKRDTIYSFLSGTDAAYFKVHAAELLKHRIIAWGHDKGYKSFVVGGGLKANDGLFQFKRKFEPLGLVDFWVRRVVWNREQYDLLVAAREESELEQGRTWRLEPAFFPAYRADSAAERPQEAM